MVSLLFGHGPDYYTDKLLTTVDEWRSLARTDEAGRSRVGELLRKYSGKLKVTMYGDGAKEPQDAQCEKLARAWQSKGLVDRLVDIMRSLDFESRKDVSLVFCALMRGDHAGFARECMGRRPQLVRGLFDLYPEPEVALAIGPMIRECIHIESLHRALLIGDSTVAGGPLPASQVPTPVGAGPSVPSPAVASGSGGAVDASSSATSSSSSSSSLPSSSAASGVSPATVALALSSGVSRQLVDLMSHYVILPEFEVCADAFATLSLLLTEASHKPLIRKFLMDRHEPFFQLFADMLRQEHYPTRLQGLKLLGEILLDRGHFDVMTAFVQRTRHLRLVMDMLRQRQPALQFEAFQVFKVFVANPHKPPTVTELLLANRARLVAFLRSFHNDRHDDQFHEEKALLIDTLENRLSLPADYTPLLAAPTPKPATTTGDTPTVAAPGTVPAVGGAASDPPAPIAVADPEAE